jgi:peptidoglycan/LPS O-acetylase OafA/YrhL
MDPSSNQPTGLRHTPALDGLRGLAIVLVMWSHFINVGGWVDDSHAGLRLLRGGFVGVDLFFVLSGFLITGILLDAPQTSGRYFRVFYLRRAVRIFPLYYAILIGVYLTRPAGPDSPAWYWLFASNLGATLKGDWLVSPKDVSLSHFWSLAVEEQFYLVWPLLVRFSSRRSLEKICLSLLVLAPVIHFALHFSGNPLGAYLFTATRLNTLAAGALLALVFRDPPHWQRWMNHAPKVGLIAGGISVLGLIYPAQISLVPFAPFLWGALLMKVMQPLSPIHRAFSGRVLVAFGKYSYGLYLLHYLFDPWLKNVLYPKWIVGLAGNATASVALFMIIATFLTFSAAIVSWHFLEKPFLSLKRHFRY